MIENIEILIPTIESHFCNTNGQEVQKRFETKTLINQIFNLLDSGHRKKALKNIDKQNVDLLTESLCSKWIKLQTLPKVFRKKNQYYKQPLYYKLFSEAITCLHIHQ